MRCVTIVNGGVQVQEREVPHPGAGEVLVQVMAAALNGADILQMRGHYPPPVGFDEDRPGLEFAGEVVAAGRGAHRFAAGDRVMGITGGGAQSEQVIAHERQLMPVPASLTWEEAGGLSEVFLTAAQALFVQAEVGPGDRVLIAGAAGGVGTAAVQIARAAGAAVTGSVRTAESRAAVAEFGAEALGPAEALDRGPFDVIIDTVGGDGIVDEVKALARGGRLVVIGVGAGAKVTLNVLHLMYRSARLSATTLRAMPLEERAALARLAERRVLPLIENGVMRVQIARIFTFDEVADAYEWFSRPGKVGKVVLVP